MFQYMMIRKIKRMIRIKMIVKIIVIRIKIPRTKIMQISSRRKIKRKKKRKRKRKKKRKRKRRDIRRNRRRILMHLREPKLLFIKK